MIPIAVVGTNVGRKASSAIEKSALLSRKQTSDLARMRRLANSDLKLGIFGGLITITRLKILSDGGPRMQKSDTCRHG